jgi:3-oxoacyl-[acyl-carrier-protein] synthase I
LPTAPDPRARRGTGPVVLGAMGASTCLGGHVMAAAAAHAQISRFGPLQDMLVLDDETGERVPLTGAPVVAVTSGFEGKGRLVRLAVDAIQDLLATTSVEVDWRRIGVFLALAAPGDEGTAEEAGPAEDDDIRFEDSPGSAEDWSAAVADAIVEALGLPGDLAPWHRYTAERTGTVQALRDAIDAVAQGAVGEALVVAVDSAIDEARLSRWIEQHRLKTPSHPVGLMPGEAGVVLLLSRTTPPASQRADTSLIRAPIVECEPPPGDHPPTGHALAAVLTAAASAQESLPIGTIVCDLNGEVERAVELGAAFAQIPGGSPLLSCRQVIPAVAFGETGAAGPLLGVVLASRAFARNYAGEGSAVVLVGADDGTRAALTVQRNTQGGGIG